MKKIIFVCFSFLGISNQIISQTMSGSSLSLYNSGNTVNITGNLTPTANNTAQLGILANTNSSNGASIFLWNKDLSYPYKNGSVDLCSYGIGGHGIRFVNFDPNTGIWTDNMALTKNGKLIIGTPTTLGWDGTTAPGNYKLYVADGILTERVKVAVRTTADWSDFVFDKNYKLKPLLDVEKFIKANKHLPNIPSANEMVKAGNDLGKTDAILLQKIEELTLYMIELKKENESMKKQLDLLLQK